MKILILLAMVMVSSNVHAAVDDVHPAQFGEGSRYVRVTHEQGDKIRFEDCLKGHEAAGCPRIGTRDYTLDELRTQREYEIAKTGGACVVDAAILFGAVFTGGSTVIVLSEAAEMGATGAGALMLTSTAVGASPMLLDALNPVERVKRAGVIGDDVTGDQDITSSNIDAFIGRLKMVLANIQ